MQENYLILNDTITLSTNISSSKANTITYASNHDLDMISEFERIDLRTFYGMNIYPCIH